MVIVGCIFWYKPSNQRVLGCELLHLVPSF
jgi:hypothetical protein